MLSRRIVVHSGRAGNQYFTAKPKRKAAPGSNSKREQSKRSSADGRRLDIPTRERGGISERSILIGLIVVLNIVGSVMVLSASSVESILQYGSPWAVFERQLMWVGLGALAFFVTTKIDYRKWRRATLPLLVVTVFLLFVVLVPGLGHNVAGSSRWVGFGPLKMQPSELAKLAIVIYGAEMLARRSDKIDDWRSSLRPLLIVLIILGALIMKQPDMGTTMILVVSAMGLLFVAGTPSKQLGVVSLGIIGSAIVLGIAEPYRRERLTSFLHPFSQSSNAGYQVVQSISALGSGHILGVGLGASRAKWGFLPNAYTDFIFSVIGEELGVIGALVVVGLFVVLAIMGIRVAKRSPDKFGYLLASGITCWVVGQAVINMGAVVGILPVTGVPLPFISYGGTSLVIMMVAIGVLVNISSSSNGIGEPSLRFERISTVQRGRSKSLVKRDSDYSTDISGRDEIHLASGRHIRRAEVARRHPRQRKQ